MINGKAELILDNATYLMEKNSFAVIKSFDLHSFNALSDKNIYLIIILPDKLTNSLSYLNIETKVFESSNSLKKIIKLNSTFQSLDYNYQFVYFQLIAEVIKTHYITTQSEKSPLSIEIVDYISQNIASDLTLDNVAIACKTNRSYVSRVINKHSGTNFNSYINKIRISNFIEEYLNNKDINIEHLSYKVGFNSPRTFYRAFLSQIKCTPSEYFNKLTH